MNAAVRIWSLRLLTLATLSASVAAKDLADYRVGDIADADITTFVQLDVPDATATAAQRASAMEKIPSVFRDFPYAATNQMAVEFSTVMGVVRTKFTASLQKHFLNATLDEDKLASTEFTNFVAGFINANNRFPVNFALATEWARGRDGAEITGGFLGRLLAMMHRPVCADQLPPDFFPGEKFYAVPVAHPDDSLSLPDVATSGRIVSTTNLTKVTRLRMLFRRGFPKEQQAFANTLAAFLRPVCAPDPELTEAFRSNSVSHSVVMAHFDAGQIIVAHGVTLDEKAIAAIAQLREKTAPQKVVAAAAPVAPVITAQSITAPKPAAAPTPNYLGWVISGLAGVIAFYFFLKAARPRRRIPLVTQAAALSGKPMAFAEVLDDRLQVQPPASVNEILKTAPPDLAPHFVHSLKEAVITELATQRRDLLFAQQAAAAEIADLARRLESAQAPLLERLRAYEQRINELESELATQSKQNRELLQVKIEMLRQQMDSERGGRPVNRN